MKAFTKTIALVCIGLLWAGCEDGVSKDAPPEQEQAQAAANAEKPANANPEQKPNTEPDTKPDAEPETLRFNSPGFSMNGGTAGTLTLIGGTTPINLSAPARGYIQRSGDRKVIYVADNNVQTEYSVVIRAVDANGDSASCTIRVMPNKSLW